MNRLQKFVEQDRNGEELGRTAYGFSRENLPPPGENLEWKAVPSFNAAEEVMEDPSLKDVFKAAIEESFAIVAVPPTV
jgi:hypothetical protein